jgi:hypothetical protein
MDIAGLIRSQMLSTLFAVLDQPVAALAKEGKPVEARVASRPDSSGQFAVSVNGKMLPLQIDQGKQSQTNAVRATVSGAGDVASVLKVGQSVLLEAGEDGQSVVLRLPASVSAQTGEASKGQVLHPQTRVVIAPAAAVLDSSAELADATLKQQPLGKVMNDISRAIQDAPDAAAAMPQTARIAINRLLSTQIDGDGPVTSQSLKGMVATITGQGLGSGNGNAVTTAAGLKALFQVLKAELASASAALAKSEAHHSAQRLATDDTSSATRGASGQARDGLSSMSALSNSEDTASIVFRAAEAGEARISASQILARQDVIPDMARPDQRTLLNVELPIAMRGEGFSAEFQVDSEGHGGESGENRMWQARFSVDVPQAGLVHARAGLRGDSMSATLWAEEAETAQSMREIAEELRAALTAQGLELLDLKILHGKPPQPITAMPGHYLQSVA